MSENAEYNLGYFEGVRNCYMEFIRTGDVDMYIEWISRELAEARQLRDEGNQ